MRSTLGLTGPVRAQKSPAERRAIWVQYRGKSAAGHKTGRYVFAQPSHTENTPAASFVLLNAILLTRAPEGLPPRLQPTFSWVVPTMADFHPGGSHRFGASLRSQCRSRGVWVPRSFFTASCSLGALQTAATLDKQILDCPLCACPCSHTEPSLYYNSIAEACQPAAPIICGLYSAPSPAAFSASRPPFS